jgi:lactoylglutathione lyase
MSPAPVVNLILNFCGAGYLGNMSKVGKLLHTRYRVNDLERTVTFYRDILGLTEVRRHKSPRGSELVFLKSAGSQEEIELCHFPGSDSVQVQPDLTHLAFEVESLDEFAKHLAKHGLKFSDGPTTSSSGSTFAFVDAPEGYEIELIQNRLSRTAS